MIFVLSYQIFQVTTSFWVFSGLFILLGEDYVQYSWSILKVGDRFTIPDLVV